MKDRFYDFVFRKTPHCFEVMWGREASVLKTSDINIGYYSRYVMYANISDKYNYDSHSQEQTIANNVIRMVQFMSTKTWKKNIFLVTILLQTVYLLMFKSNWHV